jgi:hypothetical protein
MGIVLSILGNKFVIMGLAVVTILGLLSVVSDLKKENKRKGDNYEVLIGKSEQALILKKNELKDYVKYDRQIKTALRDSLKVKISQVNSLQKTSTKTKYIIKEVLRDTLIYVPTEVDGEIIMETVEAKKFTYKDPWTDVLGVIIEDTLGVYSVDLSMDIYDTLVVVNHGYKTRKWFLTRLF